mmetsp:Transcript_9514/g.12962  ORF Transcript_9514/g.12962 Transcript_9514/m.12962 type:complete len:145 (-) Transcript_9514:1216-1650(-)
MAPLKHENVIDKDLVRQLMNIDRRITKTFEEVCQDILDKKSVEYVGAYELMKHDKLKMQCFNSTAHAASISQYPSTTSQASNSHQSNSFFSIKNPASWPLDVYSKRMNAQQQNSIVTMQTSYLGRTDQAKQQQQQQSLKYISKH